jgi:hypothetical protein
LGAVYLAESAESEGGVTETDLQRDIQRRLSHGDVRLFRNQVGTYLLADGRYISSGLAVGSADLIGWQTVTITAAMVGQRIARFVSIEVKKPKGGRKEAQQKAWAAAVSDAGGFAGFARSVDEAEKILSVGV